MSNKLLLQQLKNVFNTLSGESLFRVFQIFQIIVNTKIEQKCRLVSYKCYEAMFQFRSKKSHGFGRSESEANCNCIKNFIEALLEDEENLSVNVSNLKQALKIMNEEKGKSKTQPKSKEEQGPRISINNTLYLNTSSNYQSLNIDNANMNPSNTSFDMKTDFESLSKKFGGNNMSFLHNNPTSTTNKPNEASQMEMEDILLKMVLEEGEQKKLQENGGLVENTNYLANRLNTSFENNRKKTSTSVYQPSSKVDDSKRKKEENNKNNTSFQQQNSSFVNESRMEKTFSNTICCQHEDELKKAKQKLDHLTKKMKLITEENKILKSLLENEEKKTANQMANNNKSYINKPPISNYNANNVKDVMSNKENLLHLKVEKPTTSSIIEKTRSISVDLNPNSSGSSKKDIKQFIPKLRLEVIPTYHGHNKNNKPMSQYQIPIDAKTDLDS